MMLVSLFTSRVVLNTLGVEDYGIYNVVGGVVSMFSIISSSLSEAISRFIVVELAKGDFEKLRKTFSASVTIQLIMSLIIVILIESAGVWFLNAKMVIPAERLEAANWVLQFSIVTFVINLISVPYNATIIAHERMSAFAYISIMEVVCKLVIVYLIKISPIDRLVFYAILMCAVSVLVRLVYGRYCKKHFAECKFSFRFDKDLLKRMFSFAGWNFIGVATAVLRDQGGNILINLFGGPAVNAAHGIAARVNSAVTGFVKNFMVAVNPQITKSYASGEHDYMMNLIFRSARFSFYMLLFISLPILADTHYILSLWLGMVPEHTVLFVQLALIFAMSESISTPLVTATLASGKIKNCQIVIGCLQVIFIPISYMLLRIGFIPEIITIIAIIISQCCLAARLIMLRRIIGLSARAYLIKVYLNVIVVTVASVILPIAVSNFMQESFGNFISICVISVACTAAAIYYFGFNKHEREFAVSKGKSIILKLLKK